MFSDSDEESDAANEGTKEEGVASGQEKLEKPPAPMAQFADLLESSDDED